MTLEPLPLGPLTDTERAAVERAVVRCHRLVRLPAPASIAWAGSVAAAQRYADAAIAGDLTGAPAPLRLTRAGPLARARRVLGVPRHGGLGCGFGVLLGLVLAVFVFAFPFWVLAFGPPVAVLLAACHLLRRLRVHRRVLAALGLAIAAGFAVALFALVGWLGSFPRGTFSLPEPTLQWLLPAAVGLGGVGGAMVGGLTARARLRTAGTRPDVVVEFANQLATVPSRARSAEWEALAGQDALGRVFPVWRPFPVQAVFTARRLAAVRPATRVLWRSYPGLVVVVEPPRELHVGPSGLDRWDGPALVWADGTEEYFLRGVPVPRAPSLGQWSVEEIHAVGNTEVRRVMIETIGWDEYVRAANLELVAEAPDPGNPPHRLEMYALPEELFGPLQLLVMVNGSPDRSGAPRRYAEFVPGGFADPVQAAAWQYGVDVEVYRDLQRRT